jgi:hypothetical protein
MRVRSIGPYLQRRWSAGAGTHANQVRTFRNSRDAASAMRDSGAVYCGQCQSVQFVRCSNMSESFNRGKQLDRRISAAPMMDWADSRRLSLRVR